MTEEGETTRDLLPPQKKDVRSLIWFEAFTGCTKSCYFETLQYINYTYIFTYPVFIPLKRGNRMKNEPLENFKCRCTFISLPFLCSGIHKWPLSFFSVSSSYFLFAAARFLWLFWLSQRCAFEAALPLFPQRLFEWFFSDALSSAALKSCSHIFHAWPQVPKAESSMGKSGPSLFCLSLFFTSRSWKQELFSCT